MATSSFSPTRNAPNFASLVYPRRSPAVEATAAAVTYSVSQVLGGLILRDPNGAARADLLPTAAALVAALQGAAASPALGSDRAHGSSFEFEIRNTADAAETITVTTNTGLTLSGTMTIAQLNQKRFIAVVTNAAAGSEAVTVYSAGTVVF